MVEPLGIFVLITALVMAIACMLGYYWEENINGVMLGLILGSGFTFIFRNQLLAVAQLIIS